MSRRADVRAARARPRPTARDRGPQGALASPGAPARLDYRYNSRAERGDLVPLGRDPVIVVHRGEYYLATIAGGYWHSTDPLDAAT